MKLCSLAVLKVLQVLQGQTQNGGGSGLHRKMAQAGAVVPSKTRKGHLIKKGSHSQIVNGDKYRNQGCIKVSVSGWLN